jgi:predicted adenine nucleotide alpha hydrolase (AANH) superfamily ATPase
VKKKLLLHICCGPCAIYVWQKLQAEFAVSGFFCNPNIQPFGEFEFRRLELVKLAERFAWPVTYLPYEPRGWFAAIRGLEREAERGARCPVCFRFRLEKAFHHARAHGFDAVASTLSISPSKRTAQINEQGYALAESTGVAFVGEDFKKKNGFLISRRQGKDLGVKHQDYCGCVYSKVERLLRQRQQS